MKRWRALIPVPILRALLLVPALLALVAGGAAAQAAPPSQGLDPSFGNGGKTTVAVGKTRSGTPQIEGMALGPQGRVFVLERSLLLAFEPDGRPAAGFGSNGRVAVAAAGGKGQADGLAVDSQGRVVITGTIDRGYQKRAGHRFSFAPVYGAYVLRLLPDGDRDVTFGSGGEVQTTFGLPLPAAGRGATYPRASALATTIVVDSMDRPIIGGGYAKAYKGCGATTFSPEPFVARLTATGAPDTTFAGTGYALIEGHGEVWALARTPEGGSATISHGISCGARVEEEASLYSAFTEAGEPAPGLDPERPIFHMRGGMAIDPQGRVLVVQIPAPVVEGPAYLDRLLPNGDVDESFGAKGGVVLKGVLGAAGAFTVDAQGRPILSIARHHLELRRLDANGSLDGSFGPGGRLYAQEDAPARAVALDGEGRIYTAGIATGKKSKTGFGVQIARLLPGA